MIRGLILVILSVLSLQVMAFKSSIDGGGYYYIDSDEAELSYDFEDISTLPTSSLISLDDDDSQFVNIGFSFNFYGVNYSSVSVTSNGVLSFNSSNDSYGSTSIPSVSGFSEVGSSILGWWGDLDPEEGGSIRSVVTGSSPNRVFIVQFSNIEVHNDGGNNTFQFKLFETSNEIEVHYKNIYGESGEDYTVGILKDSAIGQQVWFGSANGIQDQPPGFSTPYAIKYKNNSTVAETAASQKIIIISALGTTKNRVLELENNFNSAVDIELEYLTTDGLEAAVSGPSAGTINANSALSIPFDVTVSGGNDLKDNKVFIRVSSTDNVFATFDVAVRIVIVEITQLTMNENLNSILPKSSYSGNKIAFLSRESLTAEPKFSGVSDLYVHDVINDTYQQLTNMTITSQCYSIALSGDGKWAAAVCNNDIDPLRSNVDKSKEVFLFDLENDSVKQIAVDMDASSDSASLALDYTGETLLFISNTNLAGINNSGNYEIFNYLRSADIFIQLSDFNAGVNVYGLDLDYRGEKFVTSSMSDVFGINQNLKFQVFTGSTKTGILKQVTMNDDFNSGFAKISASGEYLTFSSYAPLVAGGASGTGNVFIANFESANIDQVTNSSTLNSGYSDISADGERVVFVSRESLSGDNLSSNAEVFLFSRLTSTISQLTEVNDTKDVLGLNYSENGSVVSFYGAADWDSGKNTLGNSQVFILSGLFENAIITSKKDPRLKEEIGTTTTITVTSSEDAAGSMSVLWIWIFSMTAIFIRIRTRKA